MADNILWNKLDSDSCVLADSHGHIAGIPAYEVAKPGWRRHHSHGKGLSRLLAASGTVRKA